MNRKVDSVIDRFCELADQTRQDRLKEHVYRVLLGRREGVCVIRRDDDEEITLELYRDGTIMGVVLNRQQAATLAAAIAPRNVEKAEPEL